MGKLFKTISLEQRLKESAYNALPHSPQKSDQGSVELQAKKITIKNRIETLKITPKSADRSSDILKSTLRSKGAKPTATIQPFIPTDLTKYKIPLSSTKFRSSISLGNRLKQPFLGTTAHLAQYILSDVNTNHIKIKPFTVFNHTSNVIISPFITKPLQGNTDPITLPSTILAQGEVTLNKPKETLQEGLILVNGALKSTTNITIAAQDILQKSLVFKNGVFTSTTKITNPLQEVTQGEGTNPTISTSTPFIEKLQGIALIDNKVVSLTVVSKSTANTKQGEVQIANRQSNPVTNINEIVVPFTSHIRYLIRPVDTSDGPGVVSWGNNKIVGLKKNIKTDIALLDHQIENIPQVKTVFDPLAFSFNKEFATFYHGDKDKLKNYYPQDNSSWSIRSRAVAPLLSGEVTDTMILGGYITWGYDKIPKDGKPVYYEGTTTIPKYEGVQKIKNLSKEIEDTNPNNAVLEAMASDTSDTATNTILLDYIRINTIGGPHKSNEAYKSKPNATNKYETKTYEEISDTVPNIRKASENPNTPEYGTSTDYYEKNKNRVQGMYSTKIDNKERVGIQGHNDFVKIRFALGNAAYDFTAYLVSFSDGIQSTFADVTAVSNYQALKKITGIARAGAISFKMVAMNKNELGQMYNHLNNFISACVLPTLVENANEIPTFSTTVTVGGWWKKREAKVESVKVDVDLAETSWDIQKELPQIITVSIALAFQDILADGASTTPKSFF